VLAQQRRRQGLLTVTGVGVVVEAEWGTGHAHQNRFALGDLVVAGTPDLRTIVSEPGDRQDDLPARARVRPRTVMSESMAIIETVLDSVVQWLSH